MTSNGHAPRLGGTTTIAKASPARLALARYQVAIAKVRAAQPHERTALRKAATVALAEVLLEVDAQAVAAEIAKGERDEPPARVTKAATMSVGARLRDLAEEPPIAKRGLGGLL